MNKISFITIVILSFSTITEALQLQVQPNTASNGQVIQLGGNQLQGGIQPLLLSTSGLLQNNGLQTTNTYGSTIGNTLYSAQAQNLLTNNNLYGNNNLINTSNNSNIIYSKDRNKSCQTVYAQSNESYILDLSDTNDINTYGVSVIQNFINTIEAKKYDFVYIDLCNTNIDSNLLSQCIQLLQQKKIQVMWNLSNNSTVNDSVISCLDLNYVKGLNISNTSVSVNGILHLCSILQSNTDSTIQFINICGLNIANAKTALLTCFAQHISLWETKNSGKKYVYYKNAIIDSYDDKNNYSNYNTLGITNNNAFNTQQYSTNALQQYTQIPNLNTQTTQTNALLNSQTQLTQPNVSLNTQAQPTYTGLTQSVGQLSLPTTLQTIPQIQQQLLTNNNGITNGG